jgi:NADH-quinone oxidoreductase subunit L
VGAYHSGIFHLFTHAFFKACLFLCAGSVIHSLSDEMDIRRMGGLKGKLPHTYKTFLIATLAIAGIPPLSGFFSKDEILWSAFNSESLLIPGWILWILGVFAAACTAFYMFRLLYMTFTGPLRVEEKIRHHIHESPPVMTLPLWILAAGSITAGFLGIPKLNHFEHFLHPVFEDSYRILSTDVHHSMGVELLLMAISVAAALSGIAVARVLYKDMKSRLPERLSEKFKRTYRLIHNKYYVDEIYGASFVKGTIELSRFSGRFDLAVIDGGVNFTGLATRVTSTINGAIDKYFVDGAVNLIAWLIVFFGRRVRKIQTGDIHTYLYGVVVGALLVLIIGYVFFM